MPLDLSAGFSDATPIKQADFARCFRMWLSVAGNVADKWHARLVITDLTAGPGRVNGAPGSPVIIAETLREFDRAADVYLFERDASTAAALRQTMAPYSGGAETRQTYTIKQGDHADLVRWFIEREVPKLRGRLFGLFYVDANRRTDISFEALTLLAQAPRLEQVDMLLNLAATSGWKRIRSVGKSDRYLHTDILSIPKQYRWFRAPVGPPQWTMVFLSNYEKWTPSRQAGFFAERSERGQAILKRLNETEAERQAQIQMPLPFVIEVPTEPTPSISAILGFSPSARSSSRGAAASVNAATSDERRSRTM